MTRDQLEHAIRPAYAILRGAPPMRAFVYGRIQPLLRSPTGDALSLVGHQAARDGEAAGVVVGVLFSLAT